MIPSFRTGAAALLICALAAGACGKKPPAAMPAPPPPPSRSRQRRRHRRRPRHPRHRRRQRLTGPDRGRDLREGDARRPHQERGAEAGLLQLRLDRPDRRGARRPAEERRVPEEAFEREGDSRGARRLARDQRIQPCADRRAVPPQSSGYLVSLGVAADRVSTVAKGEEQPFCKEETEACWQQNRVGYFVFTAK